MIFTTLAQIRACDPCREGWRRILRGLNKKTADKDDLTIGRIADVASLPDALWALQSVEGQEQALRGLALLSYRLVRHSCSAAVDHIVLNAEFNINENPHWDTSKAYEAALACSATESDYIAAVALHPDARWAARASASKALQGKPTRWIEQSGVLVDYREALIRAAL